MRETIKTEKMTYKLTWKDEDTNRVSSKEFTGQSGVDHSAMDDALAMAQVVDGNLWPWSLERDGQEISYGWGGEQLTRGRLFPTCDTTEVERCEALTTQHLN